jgi:thymidylate synthase
VVIKPLLSGSTILSTFGADMLVIQRHSNEAAILEMYSRVASGPEISARGTRSCNIHNLAIVLNADEPVITNFAHRKMNLAYAKREWLWYLGADAHDNSICQYATAWRKLQQADGSFYSNYGQYLFGPAGPDAGSQFEYVISTLRNDPQSRRASMVLLNYNHLYHGNTDLVCTYAINFFINNQCNHLF